MAVTGIGAAAAAIAGTVAGVSGATFATAVAIASLAFSVGTIIGSLLFPKKVKNEGARLGDLAVTSSTFGTVRPICYGRVRIAGNIIWAKPLREQVNTESHGKKGGKSTTETTTYTYFSSFALALCEGVVANVTRIWADQKLVYDVTAGKDRIKKHGFNFRFYPGNETQLPDSIIEADKGVGNVPGYRGTCYLVFDDIPVLDYGNRIPNIQVEVTMVDEPAYDYEMLDTTGLLSASVYPQGTGVDLTRMIAYIEGNTPTSIIVVDLASMTIIRQQPMTAILEDGSNGNPYSVWGVTCNMLIGPDGALYFLAREFGATRLIRVDPNTLQETAHFPVSLAISNSATAFSQVQHLCSLTYFDPTTGNFEMFLVEGGFFGSWGVLKIPEMTYIDGDDRNMTGNRTRAIVGGRVGVGSGDAWLVNSLGGALFVSTHLYIDKLVIEGGICILTPMADILPSDINPAGTYFYDTGMNEVSYDETDDSLIFQVYVLSSIAPITTLGVFWVKWSPISGIVWITQPPLTNVTGGSNMLPSRVTDGTYAKFFDYNVIQINTATGQVTINQATPPTSGGWPVTVPGYSQIYDSEHQTVFGYVSGANTGFAKLRLGRSASTATTLGDIVDDLCTRSGFESGDTDVTDLTDVVQGFVISQRATVVDILVPLFGVHLVDGVETDYVLVFHHRDSTTATTTVIEDDLIRIKSDTAEPYTESRQQEVELPMRVTMTFADFDRDYQNNTVSAKRARNPDPTVFSDNQSDIDIAMVSTAAPAKQLVEKILFTAWNERHSFTVRLPPQYAWLDPSDTVTLSLNDGYVARTRLGAIALGVDYTLDTKLICETDGQFISTAVADQGVPWSPSHTLINFPPTQLVLLDTPLLRDIDDTGGRAIRGYWAAGAGGTAGTWPGAILQQAADTSNWSTLDATSQQATGGYLVTPPADTTALFSTQYDGTLVVAILSGSFVPSTITDFALANGGNPIALIKANGEVEILQYRDAASLGNGQYQLSVLRRAQRGTDTMANGHTAGEIVIFLSTTLIEGVVIPIGQKDFAEYYRAVTNGTIAQTAGVTAFVFHGRDLMPYAPVDFHRELSSSPPDVVATWKRRTRIGGNMVDGSDTPPLNEASEAYEAYTVASEGALAAFDPANAATYVRAFTGLGSPTLTYTAAEQTADGFNEATDTLYLVVYQLSAVVGRGFRGYQALPAL